MKRKLFPPFLMLFAGAIFSIIMVRFHYDTKTMLGILLLVLISFYIIGCLVKFMLDRFEKQIEEKKLDEGEVIEKEVMAEDEEEEQEEESET